MNCEKWSSNSKALPNFCVIIKKRILQQNNLTYNELNDT